MYLPQCVHLCIASYISSPADLYHYTRYLYNARRCTTLNKMDSADLCCISGQMQQTLEDNIAIIAMHGDGYAR